MKRIRNILITTLFTLLIGVSSIFFHVDNKYQQADAWYLLKTLYVDLSLNEEFKKEDAHPYIYSYTSEKEYIYNLVPIGNDIYQSEEPVGFYLGGDIDIRIQDGSLDIYKSEPIDTSILSNNTYYDYVCLDAFVEGQKSGIKGYGSYTSRTPNPSEATYKTQRVWLNNDNQNFYENDEWGSKTKNTVGYYDNNTWTMVDMMSITNAYDGVVYYYVDIPYQIEVISFLRTSSSENHNYLIYNNCNKYLSYGVCYFASISDLEHLEYTAGEVRGANATILSMVVESYLTYGKDNSNGATENTVKNLYITWFKNKSATQSDLKSTKIKDYTGYKSNGNSYEGLTKNEEFSVNEKWNTMCSQVGIDPNTGERRAINISWFQSEGFRAALVIGGTAVVVVGAVIIFLVIKKKKEQD